MIVCCVFFRIILADPIDLCEPPLNENGLIL